MIDKNKLQVIAKGVRWGVCTEKKTKKKTRTQLEKVPSYQSAASGGLLVTRHTLGISSDFILLFLFFITALVVGIWHLVILDNFLFTYSFFVLFF